MLKKCEFIRNRKIRILLCVELVLVLIGVAGLFGRRGVIVGTEKSAQLLEEGVAWQAALRYCCVCFSGKKLSGSARCRY